jgi:predicted nucleic acid-binding protein
MSEEKTSTNNIYVDTNVLIGSFIGKSADVNCLKVLYSMKWKNLFVSALSISQFVSTLQRKNNGEKIKEAVRDFLEHFTVIGFAKEEISKALKKDSEDLEDSFQYIMCLKSKSYYVITNNIKDYKGYLNIQVYKPSNVFVLRKK